jgi:hypothetical protein
MPVKSTGNDTGTEAIRADRRAAPRLVSSDESRLAEAEGVEPRFLKADHGLTAAAVEFLPFSAITNLCVGDTLHIACSEADMPLGFHRPPVIS